MWRCALVLALVAQAAGFASAPGASEVEVPAAVREAVERYAAEPTDANLQEALDVVSDSGRASRAYAGWTYVRTVGAYCTPGSSISSSNIGDYVEGSVGEAEAACDADMSCRGFTMKVTTSSQYILKNR
jgi:hypothetical protein